MKLEVTKSMFRDLFNRCGRGDQFSYEALGALYDHLEEIDPDYELDVIGLCCDYSEHDADSIIADYGYLVDPEDQVASEDVFETLMKYLEDNTTVIPVGKSDYLIQNF